MGCGTNCADYTRQKEKIPAQMLAHYQIWPEKIFYQTSELPGKPIIHKPVQLKTPYNWHYHIILIRFMITNYCPWVTIHFSTQ